MARFPVRMPLELTAAQASLALHAWTWVTGGQQHTCVCQFSGEGVDRSLLDLLGRQLDRCGPENLTAAVLTSPPPERCECAPVLPYFLAGIAVGFAAALCVGLLVYWCVQTVLRFPVASGEAPAATAGSVDQAVKALLAPSVRRTPVSPAARAALNDGPVA